ncbi:MAG: urate hydroxylase PuuD, partial [Acidiferrobacterales bacterium]
VQVPGLAQAKAEGTAAGITKHIAPRALLWFRWAAVVTWLSGAYFLVFSGHGFWNAALLQGASAYIGIGAWLGTIMLFNVWVLIWPNQKKVLGLVEASDDEKARAARVALLASRTNTMLSIPMLFFMVAGTPQHQFVGMFG